MTQLITPKPKISLLDQPEQKFGAKSLIVHQKTANNALGFACAVLLLCPLFPGTGHAETLSAQCHVHAGWFDSDNDNIPDIIETAADPDGDGIPNYLDEDSDGDGIPDTTEAFGMIQLSGLDSNSNNIDDNFEVDIAAIEASPDLLDTLDPDLDGVNNLLLPIDSDNDGVPNFLDLDSDNDGLDDSLEKDALSSAIDADTDEDGLNDSDELLAGTAPNNWDSDGGGVSDSMEIQLGTNPLRADDDHQHKDDIDSDNDGIPNDLEGHFDTDLDRIPNCLDSDSDGDGWPDSREAHHDVELPDDDNDGLLDILIDEDGDGMSDIAQGLITSLTDFDHDGIADMLDRDSDNDGLADRVELPDLNIAHSAGLSAYDLDADGMNNHVDLDSDNDGINDILEAAFNDEDGNGIADPVTDNDKDGIPDSVDSDFVVGNDTDQDGIEDFFDTDNAVESQVVTNWVTLEDETIILPNTDLDADSIVDRHDPDHNGDGIADVFSYFGPSRFDLDEDGLIAIHDHDDTVAFTIMAITPAPAAETNTEINAPVLRPVESYHSCDDVIVTAENPTPDTGEDTGEGTGGNTEENSEENSDEDAGVDNETDSELSLGAAETDPLVEASNPSTMAPDNGGLSDSKMESGSGSMGLATLLVLILGVCGVSSLRRKHQRPEHKYV